MSTIKNALCAVWIGSYQESIQELKSDPGLPEQEQLEIAVYNAYDRV